MACDCEWCQNMAFKDAAKTYQIAHHNMERLKAIRDSGDGNEISKIISQITPASKALKSAIKNLQTTALNFKDENE